MERRGRKPGDGVLKDFNRNSSPIEKQIRLVYGRTAGNPVAERVRWFRHLPDMMKDPRKPEFVDKRTADLIARFQQQMVNALWEFKPDWFEAMASAIKAENAAQDAACALHTDLLEIAGAPKIRRRDLLFPENAAGDAPLKARYTIAEFCELLKRKGRRTAGEDEANLERAVRRACDEIGVPYLSGKPGRRRKSPDAELRTIAVF